jgi:hypothetical protein
MLKAVTNTFRTKYRNAEFNSGTLYSSKESTDGRIIPQHTKLLAWGIFLIFFVENGTLGLLPRQVYFVYRNMRISDFLIYGLTIYSLYNSKEYLEYLRCSAMLIIKILLIYFLFQFVISTILYGYSPVEYFFRLKGLWSSFLVFPYLLLLKRGGFPYLIKLIFPVAIVSNILYIMSSLTGIAFLPDIGIEKQSLPGGMEVYRVYGGTFLGEYFFLGFLYNWVTNKFRLYQLGLVILFVIPHILAFGRSAWAYFFFTIVLMFIWYNLKKKEFRIFLRQGILITLFLISLIYAFNKFIPESEYFGEALSARFLQGQEDIKYSKGTFGSRMANINMLIDLWMDSNILFGIGMHPLWVIRPETEQEVFYAWGFSDVRWASVLTAYGLVGFLLALIFQGQYIVLTWKLLKNVSNADIYSFFLLMAFSHFTFDTFINYSYYFVTVGLWGFSMFISFYVALITFEYVKYQKGEL